MWVQRVKHFIFGMGRIIELTRTTAAEVSITDLHSLFKILAKL
jgi:hypothetical protein